MTFSGLNNMVSGFAPTQQMPMLFLGHGSPMNAIEENEFVAGWREIGKSLPRPNAILCISAHWETRGTFVTAMEKPPTIHDFGGFPRALFDVQYPAPGSPDLAKETQEIITRTPVGLDQHWGLDHGAWSVIMRLFPDADIPVIELSLDHSQGPRYHYELAKELAALRHRGVLIIGSGNMVHNLRVIDWENPNSGYEWALEANRRIKEHIISGEHESLIQYASMGREMQLAVPTPEHYLPMLYILGLQEKYEQLSFFNDKTIMGSIAMTAFRIGNN